MKEYCFMFREPSIGETIHCWKAGENYLPYKDMLYLGDDKKFKDNVLVPSKQFGFNIISLSELPKKHFRPMGWCNIKKKVYSRKLDRISSFVYIFYDNKKELEVTVRLINGIWKIKKDFEKPSWQI